MQDGTEFEACTELLTLWEDSDKIIIRPTFCIHFNVK